jgi:hypothetical protein
MLKVAMAASTVADPVLRRAYLSAICSERLSDAMVEEVLAFILQRAHEQEAAPASPASGTIRDIALASMGVFSPTGLRDALSREGFGLRFDATGVCTWAEGAALPDHDFVGLTAEECGRLLDLPIGGLHDRSAVDGSVTRGLPVRDQRAYGCPLDGDRVLVVFQRAS